MLKVCTYLFVLALANRWTSPRLAVCRVICWHLVELYIHISSFSLSVGFLSLTHGFSLFLFVEKKDRCLSMCLFTGCLLVGTSGLTFNLIRLAAELMYFRMHLYKGFNVVDHVNLPG